VKNVVANHIQKSKNLSQNVLYYNRALISPG